jgi:integrase/recombinase XerD
MLEDHLKSPATLRRLRSQLAASHVDAFADWMHHEGYRPSSIARLLKCLATWTDWMGEAGMGCADAHRGLDAYSEALSQQGRLRYRNGKLNLALTAGTVYVSFLVAHGLIPAAVLPPTALETWPVLRDFHRWALQHRGLTEETIGLYERIIVDLLGTLGDDPTAYNAVSLRAFVVERSRPHGRSRASSIATSTKAFLRFLGVSGRCRSGLENAIPSFASWRNASVPRYLAADDVKRVIDAYPDGEPSLLRDRAVILLLARLGLRAGDVGRLSFADLDWANGRISVCGKSRRHEWLPLPQDVGEAILAYVRKGRPALKMPQVFITCVAPFRPIMRETVGQIARKALRRAGVSAASNGAHVFRHSAATAMLRQGVSLAGIGAVLRHRSPSATAAYAKVDFGVLSEIAQPWPEVS